jgi:hypothetical protein
MMSKLIALEVILEVGGLEKMPVYQDVPSFVEKRTSSKLGLDVGKDLRRWTTNRLSSLYCPNASANLGFLSRTQFIGVGIVQAHDEIVGKAGTLARRQCHRFFSNFFFRLHDLILTR